MLLIEQNAIQSFKNVSSDKNVIGKKCIREIRMNILTMANGGNHTAYGNFVEL